MYKKLLLSLFALAVIMPVYADETAINDESPKIAKQVNKYSDEYIKDIKELRTNPIEKGELETTAEFNLRKDSLLSSFSNNSYTYRASVAKLTTADYKPLKYDADTETLTLSLPRLDVKLFTDTTNGNYTFKYLTYSFLDIGSGKFDTESYTARNGYGNEVNVEKFVIEREGFAILSQSNSNMNPQQYSLKVSRDTVRDILDNGEIEFKFIMDPVDKNIQSSLLIKESEFRKPTMKNPVDYYREDYMLPVRLTSLSVYDGKGNKIMEKSGNQINVPAIHE